MKTKDTPATGALRVWWIPQVPMEPFYHDVKTPFEGKLLIEALTAYDLFQLKNNIKPDYCNAGGLSVFEGGEWIDWEDSQGRDIEETDEVRRA